MARVAKRECVLHGIEHTEDISDKASLGHSVANKAVDLKPLKIEFSVAIPNETSVKKLAAAMSKVGYESQIVYDEGKPNIDPETDAANEFGPSWTVYANVQMTPKYNEIKRIPSELDQISRPSGGKFDGWGVMFGGDAEE